LRKYPQFFIPNEYLDAMLENPPDEARRIKRYYSAVILCDYCIEQYMLLSLKTEPDLARAGGWLTDERCPLHKHYWMKLWFIYLT